jgi:hypothetical protein
MGSVGESEIHGDRKAGKRENGRFGSSRLLNTRDIHVLRREFRESPACRCGDRLAPNPGKREDGKVARQGLSSKRLGRRIRYDKIR